jgi:formylglycine-generating enzyme required for sulfatase activity
VGQYPPNAWGLCDLHGNVSKWCRDWYGPYNDLPATDPERREQGPADARMVRGGSWFNYARSCRAPSRSRSAPGEPNNGIGFRVAVRLD